MGTRNSGLENTEKPGRKKKKRRKCGATFSASITEITRNSAAEEKDGEKCIEIGLHLAPLSGAVAVEIGGARRAQRKLGKDTATAIARQILLDRCRDEFKELADGY